jgi:hypothetical protein
VRGFGSDEGSHLKADGGTEACAAPDAPVRPRLCERSVELDDALMTTGN